MKLKSLIFAAMAAVLAVSCSKGAQTSGDNTKADAPKEEVNESVSFAKQSRNSQQVIELSDDNLLRSNKEYEKVTFVDFNASGCVPCKKFAPVFESTAAETPKADFVSVDIDNCPETAKAFNITGVPTVVILGKDGKVKARYEGTNEILPAENFVKIVGENL